MAKVAILTTFQEFNPWYSLTGIVKDQARMLAEYNNEVYIFVSEKYNGDEKKEFPDENIHIVKKIPFAHLHDYQNNEPLKPEHEITAQVTMGMLTKTLAELEIETVFTHDFVFTGWNKPYGVGIQRIKKNLKGVSWMHWIHSIPTRFMDWWNMVEYGDNHKLIYPNRTDIVRVAENYRTTTTAVRVIPHIKDIRIMFNFNDETCEIIDRYPALMQADFIQIYPASSDRFEAKRVAEVIKIFAYIKSCGFSVCLFIANQWATTPKHYADLQAYEKLATKYGLEPGKDFIFSSLFRPLSSTKTEEIPKYRVGVPSHILNNLMMLCNLFVFPTREETFGLVLPEVSLASGALCVLNRSLHMQQEVGGNNTLFFDFGSYTNDHKCTDPDKYLKEIAIIIIGRMHENDGIMTRTFMRKRYNYDSLYAKYYAPIMEELKLYA